VSNFQVCSGFDTSLGSFFQHHQANEALKYSAVFEENDVNVETILYIFWVAVARPIDFDELGAGVHSPFH
jgi:hypothetical protein